MSSDLFETHVPIDNSPDFNGRSLPNENNGKWSIWAVLMEKQVEEDHDDLETMIREIEILKTQVHRLEVKIARMQGRKERGNSIDFETIIDIAKKWGIILGIIGVVVVGILERMKII